jgi:asparagine synthase (glutamine-hydrolysing)
MCGICGIANFDRVTPIDGWLLEAMTESLAHRGPDEQGFFRRSGIGLGHRRLSIIDLAGGQQPIYNEDRSAAIVFNGEVYNYADLTAELTVRGHRFATRSDTEAILHAYEEYGDPCVDRLRGMFAFAIWDDRRKRLLLARDRLGIKPLYYYRGDAFLAFASEMKALLEVPGVPREIDRESLDLYLSLRYVPGPRTMFRDIWKLQPGHLLVVEDGSVRVSRYWDLPQETFSDITEADAVAEMRRLLEESVRLHLVAEVPLGVFLSGGIDSTAILAMMSKITGRQRIKTFSVGYCEESPEESSSNEFAYARMAAEAFGSEHHEVRVGPREFCDAIPKLVWHLDEPLADPSCIPLYFLSQLARQHITVVLSGEGADEALAGYSIYNKMLLLESIRRTAGFPGRALLAGAARHAPNALLRKYLGAAGRPLEERYTGVSRGFFGEDKDKLVGTSGLDSPCTCLRPYWQARAKSDALTQMLYLDTKVWLPDDILLKADKITMAHALELRVPFLDHHLIEFATRLPVKFKLRGSTGKYLLRKAMQGLLPAPILQRSKKGFPVPTEEWLRGPLKGYVRETLLSTNSACREHFSNGAIAALVDDNESRRLNRHQELWTLLAFESWHKTFLQPPRRLAPKQIVEVA